MNSNNIPPTITHSYYAATEKLADGTMPVTGWFDISSDSDPSNYPDPATLTPVSAADWQRQYTQTPRTPWQIKGGELVGYTPPPVVIPLKEQAATALQQARITVYNNYGILGEPTPAVWVTYLRSLMAIANGTDTTSTALPAAPSDTAT